MRLQLLSNTSLGVCKCKALSIVPTRHVQGRSHEATCGKQVAEVQNRKSLGEQKAQEPSGAVQQ